MVPRTAWALHTVLQAEEDSKPGLLVLAVRMGNLLLRRLHQLTKHRVFSGPGFQVAAELGEAANGGQVLLSHDAWLRLQERMHEASFPVVEQLGSYKLNAWPVPLPVYQARPLS